MSPCSEWQHKIFIYNFLLQVNLDGANYEIISLHERKGRVINGDEMNGRIINSQHLHIPSLRPLHSRFGLGRAVVMSSTDITSAPSVYSACFWSPAKSSTHQHLVLVSTTALNQHLRHSLTQLEPGGGWIGTPCTPWTSFSWVNLGSTSAAAEHGQRSIRWHGDRSVQVTDYIRDAGQHRPQPGYTGGGSYDNTGQLKYWRWPPTSRRSTQTGWVPAWVRGGGTADRQSSHSPGRVESLPWCYFVFKCRSWRWICGT